MARESPPPCQLLPGDPFNLTLGVLVASLLAACKRVPGLAPLVQWQLNAYTNWNLIFIMLRLALKQKQWDPFLAVNSVGILVGFRTAMAQGIDENMRTKIRHLGLPLSRRTFVCLDHLLHTVPPALLVSHLVRRRKRVPLLNIVYVIGLSTWFNFRQSGLAHAPRRVPRLPELPMVCVHRQSGHLDASEIYVPHPWRRTWVSILVGCAATPPLVDALIRKERWRVLALASAMLLPYLSSSLDPRLRQRYFFEFQLQRLRKEEESRTCEDAPRSVTPGGAFRSRPTGARQVGRCNTTEL
mmetsp:Transcript_5562/g.17090  ORF Transcript_5562/g.17090 Transcript_5562/m.17090 type:complete len:298 (+) Transcript_5562:93-986(+)